MENYPVKIYKQPVPLSNIDVSQPTVIIFKSKENYVQQVNENKNNYLTIWNDFEDHTIVINREALGFMMPIFGDELKAFNEQMEKETNEKSTE